MVKPEITGDTLHLHVEGLDKLWAFKSEPPFRCDTSQVSARTL
jgi:hypothetical protein